MCHAVMSHDESYMCRVGQLGAMGGDDLLQLEKQPLPESSKVPGHGGSGVQLQAQHNLSNHLDEMIACCIYQQTCVFSSAQ
jgi:hypothetical protein